MSAKTMSPLTDENRDLRKQIGCMNGIFQLFDRHHFLTGRRISGHKKRLLQGAQHQPDTQYGTKGFTEKGLEVQKEKPRISTESSRASYSSSSCSSTFSSLDFNRVAQPETLSLRQINIPESPSQITTVKERQSSSTNNIQSVVKDSMYREARGLPIKSLASDERRGPVMKHVDSPRPLQQSKSVKQKTTGYEGSTRVLTKDERLALPRFSYDGRESRETFNLAMKRKELPRLSLDSKASSMGSRLNLLGMEKQNCSQVPTFDQELGSHNRTSSVVAKLMGLDFSSDNILTEEIRTPSTKSCPKGALLSQLTSTPEESKQNQVTNSPRVSQNNAASTSPRLQCANLAKKPTTCSRFPLEPAPWRQQDSSQLSPRISSHSRKAATNTPHQSSSVYGQIEKRITELEFKRSGKDLRALKQILEAMQKTRGKLENQTGESAEMTLQLSSSVLITKPAKAMDEVKLPFHNRLPTMDSSHLQRLQTRNPKYHVQNSARGQKAKDPTPKKNNLKESNQHFPSTYKKHTWRIAEADRTFSGQSMKADNCTNPSRSFGMASPRLQQKLLRTEGQSHPTTPSSDSSRAKKHCNKKLTEKVPQNSKHKVKVSYDQLSDLSSETRHSSYKGDTASVKSESINSLVSQTETEVISLVHSANTNAGQRENSASTTRGNVPAIEIVVNFLEQPSPISVLDDTFYSEDSPSPVKKISSAFREDMHPSPEEAEWDLVNLGHLTDRRTYNHDSKYNQKLENMKSLAHELKLLNTTPDETSADQNALVYGSLNQDHRYINKILLTSGLLKDTSFISTSDQLLSSRHLINPDMFHVLEQTEEITEQVYEVTGKSERTKSNKKIQRKIIFDMVDEILVRKITSGRLFTMVKKRTSPQGLLKEVYLEMHRLCTIPDCTIDDEEDEMIRLLAADMEHQSEDWVDYSGEVPALVLDIERLIFKDLINEVVTGEFTDLHDWPNRHCRKLFSK